jgi:addiction module HigA family antidote
VRERRPTLEHVVNGLGNVIVARELDALVAHPTLQLSDERLADLLADRPPFRRRARVGPTLDIEHRIDPAHGLQCQRRREDRGLALRLAHTDDEITANGPPPWRPSHPGALLRQDVLPAPGLSITDAAEHLHVSRQMLHCVLSEESVVSPEMAIRLGKLCGDGPRNSGCRELGHWRGTAF